MLKRSAASHSDERRVSLVDEILGGAEAVGSDGKGFDGLRGYLRSLAKNYPQVFANLLLAPLIDLEPAKEVPAPPKPDPTLEEIKAEMKARGLPIPPDDWLS